MDTTYPYKVIILLVATLFMVSCQKVVVTITSIPANTPRNQPIYIAGNFNNWDPGDERYRMQLNNDSIYSIALPPGFGTVEYKFTRGDWTTVEKDICGYEIDNRHALIGERDTVANAVESWNDLDPLNCPRLTLLVKNIPDNTAKDEVIAVAGNFNNWSIDSISLLRKDSLGNYSITIDRPTQFEEIEFKFTRGDLASAESDEFGNMVPNRLLRFGVHDTVEVKIEGWIDRPEKGRSRVVIIIDKLPKNTPASQEFYLANSLNGWMPGDKNFLFQRNKQGKLFYPVPRRKKPTEYKITRGNWSSVETDQFGYDIPNRIIYSETEDTVYVDIESWKDLPSMNDMEVTVVIDNFPRNTPENDKFYITGNFNGWNPGRAKYSFEYDPSGLLFVNLPRENGLLEFKITRGSLRNVEVNEYGSDLFNRTYFYKDVDTVYVSVKNWKDLPPKDIDDITLVIGKLPGNTPARETLYLAPDFNDWDPGGPEQTFAYLEDGRPYITIANKGNQFEYKITRGNWETVEVDNNGNPIPNRVLSFGFADTVYINIVRWRDLGGNY